MSRSTSAARAPSEPPSSGEESPQGRPVQPRTARGLAREIATLDRLRGALLLERRIARQFVEEGIAGLDRLRVAVVRLFEAVSDEEGGA